jgi:phosphohistidine phosphatase
MRRLILLRHAKSDWPAGLDDFDRPLAARGAHAAPVMGRYMRDEHLLPDLAIVSAARRTVETWALVAPEVGETPARHDKRIYEAPYETLLAVIREVGPEVRTLLIVGHNPGCEELADALISHGDRFAAERMRRKYPTAGLAVIDFDEEEWSAIAERTGRLDRFVTPAALGDGPDE